MIVRDEAEVIERALRSARALVTSWRIIDTGSTDGTQELIRSHLADVPGELRSAPWVDFGTNRTELVQWARGAGQWLLLLDADMEIEVADDVAEQLARLDADAAFVPVDGGVQYRMPYLVRSDLPWHYVGRTHEHIACDGPFTTAWFDALRVLHHGDGGSRSEKFERDVRLLHQDLLEDPSNPRAHFYLAQTLRDSGDHAGAIEHYERRVALGGWDEEVFYAQYQVGVCEAALGRERAPESLARAWDLRPTRAEPLYHLARVRRIEGRFQLAWISASLAVGIPQPADMLFVEPWIYQWGVRFEWCDAAWRIGHADLARSLCAELLGRDDLPDDHVEHLKVIEGDVADPTGERERRADAS